MHWHYTICIYSFDRGKNQLKSENLDHYIDTILPWLITRLCLGSTCLEEIWGIQSSPAERPHWTRAAAMLPRSFWEHMLPSAGKMQEHSNQFLSSVIIFCNQLHRTTLTWVCARRAKSSWSFFISVLEPFRCNDKTWCLKLRNEQWHSGRQSLRSVIEYTDALCVCVYLDTQLTLWPWTESELCYSCSRCCPGWPGQSCPSQTSQFASEKPSQMSWTGMSRHFGSTPTWSSLLRVLGDPKMPNFKLEQT